MQEALSKTLPDYTFMKIREAVIGRAFDHRLAHMQQWYLCIKILQHLCITQEIE